MAIGALCSATAPSLRCSGRCTETATHPTIPMVPAGFASRCAHGKHLLPETAAGLTIAELKPSQLDARPSTSSSNGSPPLDQPDHTLLLPPSSARLAVSTGPVASGMSRDITSWSWGMEPPCLDVPPPGSQRAAASTRVSWVKLRLNRNEVQELLAKRRRTARSLVQGTAASPLHRDPVLVRCDMSSSRPALACPLGFVKASGGR